MILLRELSFGRSGEPLVSGASLQLHAGWKMALTGANGCGKSSFLALLTGALQAESGELERPATWTIAHVAQETPALPDAAIEFVLDGDSELRLLQAQIAEAEQALGTTTCRPELCCLSREGARAAGSSAWTAEKPEVPSRVYPSREGSGWSSTGERLAELHARYQDIDGWSARARAAALLAGLGFSAADQHRPVAEFSGGWRVRLNLARALMCRSDLLLLDEPTNHLDLQMREALTLAQQETEAAMVLVSHDRHLLRTSCDELWLVADGTVRPFDGDLEDYARLKAAAASAGEREDKTARRQARA